MGALETALLSCLPSPGLQLSTPQSIVWYLSHLQIESLPLILDFPISGAISWFPHSGRQEFSSATFPTAAPFPLLPVDCVMPVRALRTVPPGDLREDPQQDHDMPYASFSFLARPSVFHTVNNCLGFFISLVFYGLFTNPMANCPLTI